MNSSYFSNIFFIIILIIILPYISSNKIVLPFTTKEYPFDPNNEFKFIFKNEIFTTLDIGTPTQKMELFFTMRTPFFILKCNHSNPDYYKNTSSSTYRKYDYSSIYYFNDDILKRGVHSADKIFIQNSFDNNDKYEIPVFEFIYGSEIRSESQRHMGVLGIQFFSTTFSLSKEVNFINSSKREKCITNYVWNLNYTAEDKGYLVIGEYPHSFNNKYDKEKLMQVNVYQEGAQKVVWSLSFNSVKYGDTDLSERKVGKFAPQYGVILGPLIFDRLITKEFFEEYINNKKCERKTYDEKHDYYVCDEDIDLSKFKNIEFTEKELSVNNFILTKDDLFLKKNGKLYFLVAFGRKLKWQFSWTLGKPFIKKYNFLFDQDRKQILYYDKENDIGNSSNNIIGNKTFVYILWIGIGVLIIIIGILVYILTKVLKNRKKLLYELEDEFAYVENSGDNKNVKNDAFKFEGDENENKFGIE